MNILVTGISAGIGRAICEEALNSGHNVIGLSRSDRTFASLQKYASDRGSQFRGQVFDLDHFNDHREEELALQIRSLGSIDILVNNAGLLEKQRTADFDTDSFERMLRVNVYYPLYLTRWLKNMKLFSPRAHAINIGSMGGYQGSAKFPDLTAYSMTKAMLANFTECLAAEWAEVSISVNCLCLGAVQTEMLEDAFPGYAGGVSPQAMAKHILSFATSGAGVISGQVIPVAQKNP